MKKWIETRQELVFGIASCLMLVFVVVSMRHSVNCDSDNEELSLSSQLARQSLEARLLSVEQEAIENTIVVEKLLGLFREEKPRFAELYTDLDALSREITNAFQRTDDDLFASEKAKPGEGGQNNNKCDELRATYGIIPQISWGTATAEAQDVWRILDCDNRQPFSPASPLKTVKDRFQQGADDIYEIQDEVGEER